MEFDITQDDESKKTNWVAWHTGLGEEPFTMQVDKVVYNEDKNVFYIFDETGEENTGISLYTVNHPSSKYPNAMPNGVRFAKAFIRHTNCEANTDGITAHEGSVNLTISKTDKGTLFAVSKVE